MQSINFDSFPNKINEKRSPGQKNNKKNKRVFFRVDFHSNGAKTPTRYNQQINTQRNEKSAHTKFLDEKRERDTHLQILTHTNEIRIVFIARKNKNRKIKKLV